MKYKLSDIEKSNMGDKINILVNSDFLKKDGISLNTLKKAIGIPKNIDNDEVVEILKEFEKKEKLLFLDFGEIKKYVSFHIIIG